MAKKIKPDELKMVQAKRAKRKPPPVRYQPNVTPLIDVLFLLLLYFLLGTRFRQDEGVIPASLPELGGNVVPGLLTPIRIGVNPAPPKNLGATYVINDNQLSMANATQLHEALKGQFNVSGVDKPIAIKPRGDVRWEFVVEAFNQAARAGYKKIGFAPSGS